MSAAWEQELQDQEWQLRLWKKRNSSLQKVTGVSNCYACFILCAQQPCPGKVNGESRWIQGSPAQPQGSPTFCNPFSISSFRRAPSSATSACVLLLPTQFCRHSPLINCCSGILGQGPGDRGKRSNKYQQPSDQGLLRASAGVVLSVCWWLTRDTKRVSLSSKHSFKADLDFSVHAIEIFSEEASGKNGGESCPFI